MPEQAPTIPETMGASWCTPRMIGGLVAFVLTVVFAVAALMMLGFSAPASVSIAVGASLSAMVLAAAI